ncbi:hypothetical protein FHS61_001122 [Altererythrobacter atlanticus]|uniref:Uncharacterized protein n=1 Tax=Croceibacterium atlanticum TaxID=1267766 RepID=A0A0F7KVB8_9SPHN|nr:hypothetical protein [Croceibacterium atlanticum]AKH43177.1 hypothetical protein WYH_02143 [Croceibacterium atlanticum]MBB5732118.1 hypothetical protein [Croceibacterium atlanticum]
MPERGEVQPVPWARIALAWLALSSLLVLVNWGHIAAWRFTDPDDTLRMVQLRDLYAGQNWFDLHQYRIDPGNSPLQHWSRLVDLPLVAIIALLAPLVGQHGAEIAAVVAVPLCTLGIIMAVVGRMGFRRFDAETAILACLALGLSTPLLGFVQPMRIDHHGWQVALVMLALAAVMGGDPRRGGMLAGLALAAGLMISLEVLPLAAAFGAVLLLRWMRDPDQRWWLAGFLTSLTVSLLLLFAVTRGMADLALHCDVMSPGHIGFFACAALGAVVAAWLRITRLASLALIGLGGLAGLGLFLSVAPQCASGPFASLDPLVRVYWYDLVLEGRPFWMQPPVEALSWIAQAMVALGVSYHLWRSSAGAEREWWFDYTLFLAAALLGGLFVWRSMGFVGALAALPLGWLAREMLLRLRRTGRPLAKIGIAAGGMALLMPAAPMQLASAVMPAESVGASGARLRSSQCELRENAPKLDRFAPLTIFAPIDLGPSLLERTHHSVLATGHHRANLAMRDVIRAYIGSPDEAKAIMMEHGARMIAICTDLGEPKIYAQAAPDGFMAQLLAGNAPDWLEPVDLGGPDSFRVWKLRENLPQQADQAGRNFIATPFMQ